MLDVTVNVLNYSVKKILKLFQISAFIWINYKRIEKRGVREREREREREKRERMIK